MKILPLTFAVLAAGTSLAVVAGKGPLMGSEIIPQTRPMEVEGSPLTSVVITHCNLLVAVYVTMPDARLIRFDQKNEVELSALLAMADTAKARERIEVGCDIDAPAKTERKGVIFNL